MHPYKTPRHAHIAEALLCGTPVLAADMPHLRQVYGDAIEYYKSGDTIPLANRYFDDEEYWEKRRAAGLSAGRRFSFGNRMVRLQSMCDKVMANGATGSSI